VSSVAHQIAGRVASHLHGGLVINLGVGIPTLVADHVPPDAGVVLETENGMLGVGPTPAPGREDPDLINAGKLPITELPGASYFSSSESFAMIRGGHLDAVVLGALQVDERGRVANWSMPGRPILGVGGAMDLVAGARRIIVAMTHVSRDGEPKIVKRTGLPLTGARPASMIVTERATFAVDRDGLVLTELAPEVSLEWVAEHTTAAYRVALGTPSTTF
jgi:3-oxoacid CoA-transferase B subunit